MKQYTQNYQGFEVRCVEDENSVIWFVAKDILEAVGIKVTNSITKYISHIPEEWRGGSQITTLGGTQQIQCLTEEGVNFFLFRSDKPKALPMQKWIAGEVLPSLRKHGGYTVSDPDLLNYEGQKAYLYICGHKLTGFVDGGLIKIEKDETKC